VVVSPSLNRPLSLAEAKEELTEAEEKSNVEERFSKKQSISISESIPECLVMGTPRCFRVVGERKIPVFRHTWIAGELTVSQGIAHFSSIT
jgi:hypothetical protein